MEKPEQNFVLEAGEKEKPEKNQMKQKIKL